MGAERLKKEGSFTTELSADDVAQMMRQALIQMREVMEKKGVSAQIKRLVVGINNGEGSVEADIAASKRVTIINVPAKIFAKFGLVNELDDKRQPTGRLLTSRLEVDPESLYGIVRPIEFLTPYVGGDKINKTFAEVLAREMKKRNAKITGISLMFTPGNKLRVRVQGNKT